MIHLHPVSNPPMTSHRTLPLLIIALQAATSLASAQQSNAPEPLPRRPILVNSGPSVPVTRLGAPPLLSSNYRITFSGTGPNGKSIGELSTLTCSSTVSIAGPLSDSANPAEFRVEGQIAESEDQFVFTYTIGFTVPTSTAEAPAAEPLPRTQYTTHSSSGSLRMQPGKAYEVLKCGSHTYTITATPETDK